MDFLEKLNNTLQLAIGKTQDLYEMSIQRKKVKDIIQNHATVVMDHICKIYYLKHTKPEEVNHWCNEIATQLQYILELSMKGGNFKKDLLFEWLRDGFTKKSETEDRRTIVIFQEEIDEKDCKPLEDNDFNNIMNILNSFVELILAHKKLKRKITPENIKEIIT